MNKLIALLVAGSFALVGSTACDNSAGAGGSAGSGGGGSGGSTGGNGGDGGGGTGGNAFPPPPVLGAQIDRMGRPAINTALTHPFDGNLTTKDAAKDAYNAAPEAMWMSFAGEIRNNLAILDSLDTNCGNQAAACGLVMPTCMGTPDMTRYTTLAGVLAADKLWVNMTGTCGQFAPTGGYLAVEANLIGGPLANTDCGGRKLPADVIQTSYTLLAAGAGPFLSMPPMPIDDGIAAVASKVTGTTFPYLAIPTN